MQKHPTLLPCIRAAAVQIFPTSSFPIAGTTNKEKHFPLQDKCWIYKGAYYWYNTLTLVRADDPQERRRFGLQQDKDPAACGIIQSRMKDKTRMQMSCLSLDKSYGNQAK